MVKKILLGLFTIGVVVGGVAAMSAFEAHIINVTAHIENALKVDTKEIKFGTVFPQEKFVENIWISLSDSFLKENRVDDVEYKIVQKPKFKVYPKADVLFAFDTTGSMAYAIDDAKTNAIEIMDTLKTLIPDAGFGVVKFEDYNFHPYGVSGDTPYTLTQSITTDTSVVAGAINALTIGSGGDLPQSYTRVMYESYTDTAIDWRPSTQQILIILGDHVSHDDNLTQDPIYGLAPWAVPNPWITGYPTSFLDPGPDGLENTADDLDFQTTLKAMADNNIILYYLSYGGYDYEWDWWCAKTSGSAVEASDYGTIPEAIKGLFVYKNLCPYLSKLKKEIDPDEYQMDTNIPDDIGVPSPHGPGAIASGYMSKLYNDIRDGWDIDLVVPCFIGMCDQDYDPAVYGPPLDPRLEGQDFGCDLWIEITDISELPI
ncbi:VWA domain-containing protein [Candidatus Parcubacteria bacterium]|nr:VWA domain-containing protein [Candidatus Parcubacteria bacterium]